MVVEDCGELAKDEDWKYCDDDETADKLPPFPNDWDLKDDERSVCDILECYNIKKIKNLLSLIEWLNKLSRLVG